MTYRTYIIMLFALLLNAKARAQTKIGLKKAEIMSSISTANKQEFLSIGTSLDGLNYIIYRDKIDVTFKYIYYFDNEGVCISDGVILPKMTYPDLVKRFNVGYKITGNDSWEDAANNLKITIRPIPESNSIIIQNSKLK